MRLGALRNEKVDGACTELTEADVRRRFNGDGTCQTHCKEIFGSRTSERMGRGAMGNGRMDGGRERGTAEAVKRRYTLRGRRGMNGSAAL